MFDVIGSGAAGFKSWKVTMDKLYGLMVCEHQDAFFRYLSFSHSIEKLKASVFIGSGKHWYVTDNGAESYLDMAGKPSFPIYKIEEVNFIA